MVFIAFSIIEDKRMVDLRSVVVVGRDGVSFFNSDDGEEVLEGKEFFP